MNSSNFIRHGITIVALTFALIPTNLVAQSGAARAMLNGMRDTNQLSNMLEGFSAREANKAKEVRGGPPADWVVLLPPANVFGVSESRYMFGPYRIGCPPNWTFSTNSLLGVGNNFDLSSPDNLWLRLFVARYQVSLFATLDDLAQQELQNAQVLFGVRSSKQRAVGVPGTAFVQVVETNDGRLYVLLATKFFNWSYTYRYFLPPDRTPEDERTMWAILSSITLGNPQ